MPFPHESGNERPSYWIATAPSTDFPPLTDDARADVCVIGAGIAGLTTAYLLAKQGKSVIVLDRERIAMAETGHTTAHLQIVVDTRLATLVDRFGLEEAKLAWDSQLEAVHLIEQIARDERISCELERIDAFLYSPDENERDMLEREVRLAREIGYEAEMASPSDVPFPDAKAVARFPHQGKFHPRKFLIGMARAMEKRGVRIHEGTYVKDVEEGEPAVVRTEQGASVTADWVVHATNVPFLGSEVVHAKVMPHRTYVIGARVPAGKFKDALYWDTRSPYHYARVEEGGTLVILGGEDHKVGAKTDTNEPFERLAAYLSLASPEFEIEHRWSGEVIETEDDFPFIGHALGRGDNELMATGFSGTGMTNGTLAGLMLAERIMGRGTPFDELYASDRITLKGGGAKKLAKHNLHATRHLIETVLGGKDAEKVRSLGAGEGIVIKNGAHKIAVSRDEQGLLHALDAACTHMGCSVAWNAFERSWDCPCHGSRFNVTGEVMHGPANAPLGDANLPDEALRRPEASRER